MSPSRDPWSHEIFRAKYPRGGRGGEGAHRRVKILYSTHVDGVPAFHVVYPVRPDGTPGFGPRTTLSHETLLSKYAPTPVAESGDDGSEKHLWLRMDVCVEATYGPDGKLTVARLPGGPLWGADLARVPQRVEDARQLGEGGEMSNDRPVWHECHCAKGDPSTVAPRIEDCHQAGLCVQLGRIAPRPDGGHWITPTPSETNLVLDALKVTQEEVVSMERRLDVVEATLKARVERLQRVAHAANRHVDVQRAWACDHGTPTAETDALLDPAETEMLAALKALKPGDLPPLPEDAQ